MEYLKPSSILRSLILLTVLVYAVLVNGDGLVSDDKLPGNDKFNGTVNTVSLNASQYCFVDDNTIRITLDTTILLNINDSTDDVIMAVAVTEHTAVIFTAPANGSRCRDNNRDSDTNELVMTTALYVIQMIAYSFTLLIAIGNITVHLLVKDLHTVSGILIIVLCVSVIMITLIAAGSLTNAYVNEITLVCVVLINTMFILLFIYQATRLTLLYHFAYLMYQSYRLVSSKEEDKKSKLFKYILFIIVSSTLCYLLAVGVDTAISGTINGDMERYCLSSDLAFTRMMLVYGELGVFVILEYVTFGIGLTLYYLVSRNCCAMKSINLRVTMALCATVGISLVLLVSLNKARVPVKILIPAVTTSTLVEQIILLALFMSTNKVVSVCKGVCANHSSTQKNMTQQSDMMEQV